MKVTIITLYDAKMAEHFCAIVEGKVSHEEFEELAKGLNAVTDTDLNDIDDIDDIRQLFKTEMETHPALMDVKNLSVLY